MKGKWCISFRALGHQELIKKTSELASKLGVHTAVFTFSNHPRDLIPGSEKTKNILYRSEKERLMEELGVEYLFDVPFTEEIMKIEDENERRKLMMAKMKEEGGVHHAHGGCPGSRSMQFNREASCEAEAESHTSAKPASHLAQWPCQIKLVSTKAPFFDGAKLLIAADCTAYAYANMHEDFMKGRTTIIGCPKLDDIDYSEKLTEIIKDNDIRDVTIVRMEVPCCGGLEQAAKNALQSSGKFIPWQVVTISRDGRILN